jgi:hypothetical protein
MKTRLAAGAVACAAALAAAATSVALASQDASAGTARAGAHSAASVTPQCRPSHLSAGLHGSQVGLGNRGFILTLTNTGGSSCTVDGYPGLGLEDGTHHVLPSHTHWGSTYFDTDPGPAAIVLSPGETASADLAYGAGNGTPSDSVATYLQVTPPNATSYLTVPIPSAPVRINDGNLFVTAMARHTNY